MPSFNVSTLQTELQSYIGDYTKIYGLKLANGFDEKRNGDLVVMPTENRMPLVRDSVNPILQPGKTGSVNFTNNVLTLKNRMAQIKPFKADLQLGEVELYQWSKSFLAQKLPETSSDIYGFSALAYYMGRIMDRAGKDINGAIYSGVLNTAGGVGGANLFDGLGIKFLQGFTTVAGGGVEDIPATNVFAAAAVINQANILTEIQKAVNIVINSDDLVEYAEEDATYFMPFRHYAMMKASIAAQPLTKGDEVVMKTGTNEYRLSMLPNTIIKPRNFLFGKEKQFWTPKGNLFFLVPDANGAADVANITTEYISRNMNIFLDGEAGVDYADGRLLVMNNKW